MYPYHPYPSVHVPPLSPTTVPHQRIDPLVAHRDPGPMGGNCGGREWALKAQVRVYRRERSEPKVKGESAREGEPVGSLGSKDPTSVHSPFTPLRSSPLASLDHSRAPPPPRVPTIGTGTFPAMRPNGGYRRGGGVA